MTDFECTPAQAKAEISRRQKNKRNRKRHGATVTPIAPALKHLLPLTGARLAEIAASEPTKVKARKATAPKATAKVGKSKAKTGRKADPMKQAAAAHATEVMGGPIMPNPGKASAEATEHNTGWWTAYRAFGADIRVLASA